MLPLSAAMMPTSRVTAALVARFGARAVCVAGLLLVAAGLAIISRIGTGTPYWLMLAGLVPLGVGMGAAMTPATSAITEALPQAQQGVGSALNDLSREVGGALGTAVIGSIVTAVYRSSLQLRGVPAPVAHKAQQSFAIAIHAGGPIGAHARAAFVDGIHTGLLYAAGAAILAAIAVATLLSRDAEDPPPGRRGRGRRAAAGGRHRVDERCLNSAADRPARGAALGYPARVQRLIRPRRASRASPSRTGPLTRSRASSSSPQAVSTVLLSVSDRLARNA